MTVRQIPMFRDLMDEVCYFWTRRFQRYVLSHFCDRPSQFLRFAFEDTVFKFRILQFGLPLSPFCFMKCTKTLIYPPIEGREAGSWRIWMSGLSLGQTPCQYVDTWPMIVLRVKVNHAWPPDRRRLPGSLGPAGHPNQGDVRIPVWNFGGDFLLCVTFTQFSRVECVSTVFRGCVVFMFPKVPSKRFDWKRMEGYGK